MARKTQDFNDWLRSHGYEEECKPPAFDPLTPSRGSSSAYDRKASCDFEGSHSVGSHILSSGSGPLTESKQEDENVSVVNTLKREQGKAVRLKYDNVKLDSFTFSDSDCVQNEPSTPRFVLDEFSPRVGKHEMVNLRTTEKKMKGGLFGIEERAHQTVALRRNIDLLRDKAELAVATRELEIKGFYLQRLKCQLNHWSMFRLLKAFLRWKSVTMQESYEMNMALQTGVTRLSSLLMKQYYIEWKRKTLGKSKLRHCITKLQLAHERRKKLSAFTRWARIPPTSHCPTTNAAALSSLRSTFQNTIDAQLNENKHLAARLLVSNFRMLYYRAVKRSFDKLRIFTTHVKDTDARQAYAHLQRTLMRRRHKEQANSFSRAFRIWYQQTVKDTQLMLKLKFAGSLCHWLSRSTSTYKLRVAFTRLKENGHVESAALKTLFAASRHWILRAYLLRWRNQTSKVANRLRSAKAIHKALDRVNRQKLLRSFLLWRGGAAVRSVKLCCDLNLFTIRRETSVLALAFNNLRAYGNRRHGLRCMLYKLQRRASRSLLVSSWTRWKHRTKMLQRVERGISVLQLRIKRIDVASCFRKLVLTCQAAMQREALKNVLIARSFYMLIKNASHRSHRRQTILRVVNRLTLCGRSNVLQAFLQWKHVVCKQKLVTTFLTRVGTKNRVTSLRVALHMWKLATQTHLVRQIGARQIVRRICSWRHRSKRIAFELLLRNRHRRIIAEKFYLLWQRHLTRIFFTRLVQTLCPQGVEGVLDAAASPPLRGELARNTSESHTNGFVVYAESASGEADAARCFRRKVVCFSAWKQRVVKTKMLKFTVHSIIRCWQCQDVVALTSAWNSWTKRVAQIRHIEASVSRLDKLLTSQRRLTPRLALDLWQAYVSQVSQHKSLRLQGLLVRQLIRKSKFSSLQYSFSHWQGQTKRQTKLLQQLCVKMKETSQRCLRSGFSTWVRQHQARQDLGNRLQAHVDSLRISRLRHAWKRLTSNCLKDRISESCFRVLSNEFHRASMLEESFKHWMQAARQSISSKKRIVRVLRTLTNRTLAVAFRKLQEVCRNHARQRRLRLAMLVCRKAERELHKNMVRCMTKWKCYVSKCKYLESVVVRSSLRTAFQHWKFMFVRARTTEEAIFRLLRLNVECELFAKQRAFHKLKLSRFYRTVLSTALRTLCNRLYVSRVSAAFESWRINVQNSKLANKYLTRMLRRMLSKGFTKWKQTADVHTSIEGKLKLQILFVKRMMMWRRTRLLRGWNVIAGNRSRFDTIQRSVLLVTRTWKNIEKRRALRKWKSFAQTAHALLVLETKVEEGIVRSCFTMWRLKCVTVYRHLAKLNTWAYKGSMIYNLRVGFQRIKQRGYRRLEVSHGLTKLVHHLGQHYALCTRKVLRRLGVGVLARRKLVQIGRRLEKGRLRSAFLIWLRRVPAVSSEGTALELLRCPDLRVAFTAWRYEISHSVGRRRTIGAFARMFHNNTCRKQMHAALHKWKVATYVSRQVQHRLSKTFTRLTSGRLRQAFQRLKANSIVAHQRQFELANALNNSHHILLKLRDASDEFTRKCRAFSMLRQWQHRCATLESALLRWNTLKRLRSSFHTWKTLVERLHRLKTVVLRLEVRKVFASWRMLAQVKARRLEHLRSRLSLVAREDKSVLHLAFTCLKQRAQRTQRLERAIRIVQLISRNVAHSRLGSSFSCWKDVTWRASFIEAGMFHVERLLRRKRVDACRYAVQKLVSYSVFIHSSTRVVRQQVAKTWLLKWNARLVWSRKCFRVNRILEKLVKAKSFRKLYECTSDLKLRKSILLKKTTKNRLAVHFGEWRQKTVTNSLKNRVVLLAGKLARRIPLWHKRAVFHRLKHYTAEQRTVSMTENCRRKYRLAVVFYKWKGVHRTRVTTFAIKELRVMSKYYRRWHLAVETQRKNADCVAMEFLFRERVGKCLSWVRDHQETVHVCLMFAEWKRTTISRINLRNAVTRVFAMANKQSKRIVLSRLKTYFKFVKLRGARAKVLFRCFSSKQRKLLQLGMAIWHLTYRDRVNQTSVMKRLGRRCRLHVLHASFTKWQNWNDQALQTAALVERMLVVCRKGELRCSLERFRRACVRKQVSIIQAETRTQDLRAALLTWSMKHRICLAHGAAENYRERCEAAKHQLINTKCIVRERNLLQTSWSRLKTYSQKHSLSREVTRQLRITQAVIDQRVAYQRQCEAFRVWSRSSRGNRCKWVANASATLLIAQNYKSRRKCLHQCFSAWRRQTMYAKLRLKLDYSLCETLVQRCIFQWFRRVDSVRFGVRRSFSIWKNAYQRSLAEMYQRVSENLSMQIAQKQHDKNERFEQLESHNKELLDQSAKLKDSMAQEQKTFAATSIKLKCMESELEQKEGVIDRLQEENEAFRLQIEEDRESLSLSQLRVVRVEKENVLMQYQVNALEKELAEVQPKKAVDEENPDLASLRAGMEIDLETLKASTKQDTSYEDSTTMRAYCEQIELRCFQALGQLREATSLLKQKDRTISRLQEELANSEH